jgi:hypothetical protein
MPKFPEPKYGSTEKPFRTIDQVLDRIPRTASLNDPKLHARPLPRPFPPYDSRIRLRFCITRSGGHTNGTRNYHPSGLRDFTIREYASLQGFPHDFQFATGKTISEVIGMVGGSVPPTYSKPIYAEVMKTLRDTDRGLYCVSRSLFDYPVVSPRNQFSQTGEFPSAPSSIPPSTTSPKNFSALTSRSERKPKSPKRSRRVSFGPPSPQKRRKPTQKDASHEEDALEHDTDVDSDGSEIHHDTASKGRISKKATLEKASATKVRMRNVRTAKSSLAKSPVTNTPTRKAPIKNKTSNDLISRMISSATPKTKTSNNMRKWDGFGTPEKPIELE